MKNIKRMLLSLCICFLISTPVFANANTIPNSSLETKIDISNIELGKIAILPDGAILTPISKEEYINRLANEKNISLTEAYKLETQSSKNSLRSGTITYYDYSKTFTYSQNTKFKADLQATIKIWSQYSYRQIQDVLTVSSRRNAGQYNYRWVQTDSYSDPRPGSSAFPTTSVTLGAKGYFSITSTTAINTSWSLPGFSLGSSVGGEYVYESSTLSMRSAYSLY